MHNGSGQAAARPPMSGFNRFFVRWLASPLGFLSGSAVLVRYEGRRSGKRYALPVNAARYGGGYLISVGNPEAKTWWRNFMSPWPIELARGGSVVRGTGVVVPGSTGRGQEIARDFFATHHGAAKRAGLPRFWKGEPVTPEQLAAAAATKTFIAVTPDHQAGSGE